jgi:UTP:GlnB (protein PII) uridylyltransferase
VVLSIASLLWIVFLSGSPFLSYRVVVDNETREDCTLVKVDSVNRDGVLLEMVQLLTDLDLVISKSYISSDGGWLMDGKTFSLDSLLSNNHYHYCRIY